MAHWATRLTSAPPIGLTVIPGARVFPGNVQTRSKTEHTGGQLVLDADAQLLPASWCPMDGRLTLPTDVDVTASAEMVTGDHYFLGSVHPHFGHVMLEGLARVWAFAEFAAAHPGGRIIIYESWTPDFAMTLLEMAGIDTNRLLRPSGPIVVERLHVPDISGFSHQWIAPEQADVWRTIGDRADGGAEATRRVYLTRRGVAARRLVQEAEVEAAFAAAGFEVIQPEALPITEQIRLARSAEVLAGCVGSQMYLAAFQPQGARTLVLAPANFFLPDDAIIAEAMGHDLSVAFGGLSAYRMPQGPWEIDPAAALALIASLDD